MKPGPKPQSIADRLLENIERVPWSGCWIWTGALQNRGYGVLNIGGQAMLAHRISYQQFVGPLDAKMLACHRCDVRCCINPDHLFPGTIADNNADMKAKDRHNRGERHGMAKVTADIVREIRAYPPDVRQPVLAEKYGLRQQTISDIRLKKRWMHIQ